MERELINRTLQNILDVKHPQFFHQFNENIYDVLYHFFDNENFENEYKELILRHKKTIETIENNSLQLKDWTLLCEDLRAFKRNYLF